MAHETPPEDTFTNYELGENAARELALGAEELAEEARKLPAVDPRRISMTEAAAAALAAATPFLDKRDKRRFATTSFRGEATLDGEKLPAPPPAAAA